MAYLLLSAHRCLGERNARRGRQAGANHKRVFRIMKREGLLFQRHPGHRKARLHDGKVVVMGPNLRWCSDVFKITRWNGEVRAQHLRHRARDRKVLLACGGRGIRGSMARDMVPGGRGAAFRPDPGAPHAVEFLSDNGSPFAAR